MNSCSVRTIRESPSGANYPVLVASERMSNKPGRAGILSKLQATPTLHLYMVNLAHWLITGGLKERRQYLCHCNGELMKVEHKQMNAHLRQEMHEQMENPVSALATACYSGHDQVTRWWYSHLQLQEYLKTTQSRDVRKLGKKDNHSRRFDLATTTERVTD